MRPNWARAAFCSHSQSGARLTNLALFYGCLRCRLFTRVARSFIAELICTNRQLRIELGSEGGGGGGGGCTFRMNELFFLFCFIRLPKSAVSSLAFAIRYCPFFFFLSLPSFLYSRLYCCQFWLYAVVFIHFQLSLSLAHLVFLSVSTFNCCHTFFMTGLSSSFRRFVSSATILAGSLLLFLLLRLNFNLHQHTSPHQMSVCLGRYCCTAMVWYGLLHSEQCLQTD